MYYFLEEMIPAPTNKSKKNDTISKSHVSETTVPDPIVPPILEESLSLSEELIAIRNSVNNFTSKLDTCIKRLAALEDKLNLQQPTLNSYLLVSLTVNKIMKLLFKTFTIIKKKFMIFLV